MTYACQSLRDFRERRAIVCSCVCYNRGMQKTERLVAITLLLQARGKMTARYLAGILNVSTRTIYRDIDALSLAHVPVSMDYGPGGGFYLAHDYRFEPSGFTRGEVTSLLLGGALAGNYSLFAYDDDLRRALLKLEATLPREYRADVRAARERVLFDTTAWYNRSTTTAYLETIRSALWASTLLEIQYPIADRRAGAYWLRVEPYGLVYKGISLPHVRTGVWFLVAFCLRCRAFCTFRVRAIEDVKLSDQPIALRPAFDLHAYWEDAREQLDARDPPFALTLHISSAARSRVHGNFTILREEPSGSATIQAHLDSSEDAVAYALALGTEARVIGPPEVGEAVAARARAVAQMYLARPGVKA
jgi:predicted DNA-binding transcriptional regulator YafY